MGQRFRQESLYGSGGFILDGVLRAVLSMRFHAGSDPTGDEQLAMASVHFRLHDRSRLCGGVGRLSGRQLVWRLILYGKKMQMNYSWQFIIAGGIILLAVAYLIRRALRSWRHTSQGCGG